MGVIKTLNIWSNFNMFEIIDYLNLENYRSFFHKTKWTNFKHITSADVVNFCKNFKYSEKYIGAL